ncbi:MAG: hypothetical protein PHS92_01940 [Candidatus Gracilibacteria bacterium]|nr:hypothetical protein [Candidatus Gracilibacteria bacterium]
MGNGLECKDWSKMNDEELLKELNKESELFILNNVSVGDSLMIVKTIDAVWEKVNAVTNVQKKNLLNDTLRRLYVQSRYQATGTELFFQDPPREGYEGMRSGPVACVYDLKMNNGKPVLDKQGGNVLELSYANNAYLIATGLSDFINENPREWVKIIGEERNSMNFTLLENVKYLANEQIFVPELGFECSKLYLIIYDFETIRRINDNYKDLDTKGGYSNIYEMKLTRKDGKVGTGRFYLWHTLNNSNFKGNIRSAIEVNRNHPLITKMVEKNRGLDLNEMKARSFGFLKTIELFKNACNIILKGQVDGEFDKLLRSAVLGDVFINESNYLIRGFDGKNHYANKPFLKNSCFNSVDEIEQAITDEVFAKKLYGKTEDEVREFLESLERQKNQHYNNIFSPIIGIDSEGNPIFSEINYDTFLVQGPDYDLDENDVNVKLPIIKTFGVGAPQ